MLHLVQKEGFGALEMVAFEALTLMSAEVAVGWGYRNDFLVYYVITTFKALRNTYLHRLFVVLSIEVLISISEGLILLW